MERGRGSCQQPHLRPQLKASINFWTCERTNRERIPAPTLQRPQLSGEGRAVLAEFMSKTAKFMSKINVVVLRHQVLGCFLKQQQMKGASDLRYQPLLLFRLKEYFLSPPLHFQRARIISLSLPLVLQCWRLFPGG